MDLCSDGDIHNDIDSESLEANSENKDSWEEVNLLMELLSKFNQVDVKSNVGPSEVKNMRIKSQIIYSTFYKEYVMVVTLERENLNIVSLNKNTTLKAVFVHSELLSLTYPTSRITPLNVLDKRLSTICSRILFSSTFRNKGLLVSLTYTDGILEISFQDLVNVLRVAGAKVNLYNP